MEGVAAFPTPGSLGAALRGLAVLAAALAAGGETETNGLGMELVRIPPGEFWMGAVPGDEIAKDDERPRRLVHVTRAFFLGVTEVTVGQFRAFVEATGYRTAAETDGQGASGYDPERRGFVYGSPAFSWSRPGYPQADDHPVVDVDWYDAREFCAWLSGEEEGTYRLPTEAEWEYACRAGTSAPFVEGDAPGTLEHVANSCDQALARAWDTSTVARYGLDPASIRFVSWDDGWAFTAPVKSFRPNAFGLHDMLGNAGEFCLDGYDPGYYGRAPAEDPPGPDGPHAGHVVRGGTFLNGPDLLRASSRVECPDTYRNYVIGFRVVREAAP